MLFDEKINICSISTNTFIKDKDMFSISFGGYQDFLNSKEIFSKLQDLGIVDMYATYVEANRYNDIIEIIYKSATVSQDYSCENIDYKKISIPVIYKNSVESYLYYEFKFIENTHKKCFNGNKIKLIPKSLDNTNIEDVKTGTSFLRKLEYVGIKLFNINIKRSKDVCNYSYCIINGYRYIFCTYEEEYSRNFTILPVDYTYEGIKRYFDVFTRLESKSVNYILSYIK